MSISDALKRIEERLDRIERKLEPLERHDYMFQGGWKALIMLCALAEFLHVTGFL